MFTQVVSPWPPPMYAMQGQENVPAAGSSQALRPKRGADQITGYVITTRAMTHGKDTLLGCASTLHGHWHLALHRHDVDLGVALAVSSGSPDLQCLPQWVVFSDSAFIVFCCVSG